MSYKKPPIEDIEQALKFHRKSTDSDHKPHIISYGTNMTLINKPLSLKQCYIGLVLCVVGIGLTCWLGWVL